MILTCCPFLFSSCITLRGIDVNLSISWVVSYSNICSFIAHNIKMQWFPAPVGMIRKLEPVTIWKAKTTVPQH